MKDKNTQLQISDLKKLYNSPLPSNRNGALYNAFSYPTKISPESIGIFIACHTDVGATVLDPFAGSGTTGLATMLCDKPTKFMIDTAKSLGLNPKWGKRNAVLYELSTLGSFVSDVMCNPPSPDKFEKLAQKLLKDVESEVGNIYSVVDNDGNEGFIRYVIWSDVLECPKCKKESTFWDIAVTQKPLSISSAFKCPHCKHSDAISNIHRATENSWDVILNKNHVAKKRVPVKIYGRTGKKSWSRLVTKKDISHFKALLSPIELIDFPKHEINWGVLYRKGYHTGISHLHHFYTERNAIVFSRLWNKISSYPLEYQDALKFLLLSYNSSHSTLMTRVVVKKNSTDFVITGSQSGVLYISGLPIEKNILEGVRRKISTLKQAFKLVENSNSKVRVYNSSSTKIEMRDQTVDYVFTDPPFGDYIPYSEINQINEAWLGNLTNQKDEAIMNVAQKKGIDEYRQLMQSVFSEVNRVLKKNGSLSLVFHSAKAEIWQALIDSYQRSNFTVVTSSILDKLQGSFKQVISNVKVQGDPLLLLYKSETVSQKKSAIKKDYDTALIKKIISNAFLISNNLDEQTPERLFSRYINACLELGKPVLFDAGEFYSIIKHELPNPQYSM
ncbi:MAG: DNA methylase [Bacteroidetes bacterium]|nr:DNA methylase [Bacteroidota bacterium]